MAMLIYLFRHGDKMHAATSNPPLSDKGFRQSLKLADMLSKGEISKPKILLSSPKTRAVQTFEPWAAACGAILRTLPELDERTTAESSNQFYNRVKTHVSWLTLQATRNDDCHALVTHSDWILDALTVIPSDTDLTADRFQMWPPAQYMSFEISDGLWHLQKFAQVL